MKEQFRAFVIGSRHGDFLLRMKILAPDGSYAAAYCAGPGEAQWFESEELARSVIAEMDMVGLLEVLPLYDLGKQWKVGWPKDWDAGLSVA